MATDFRFHVRSGQAMIELAVALFAFSLVLAAVFSFTHFIVSSLDIQREVRAEAGLRALVSSGGPDMYLSAIGEKKTDTGALASDYLFGTREVTVKESVYMPAMWR